MVKTDSTVQNKSFQEESDTLAQDTKVIIKKIKRHIENGCECCAEALRKPYYD